MRARKSIEVAYQAFKKHQALHPLTHYTGILSLHGLARLALNSGDERLVEECHGCLLPFVRGEHEKSRFQANFGNYYCGGNGTALLFWQGKLPEAQETLRDYAEDLMLRAPRDAEGIFCHPRYPGEGRIWIDAAFAVTPFLLFAGLAFGEERYVEEAFRQSAMMYAALRDAENGLLHQSRGFAGPGRFSEDHWSRGNGWGMLALSELVSDIPAGDRRRPAAERMFVDLVSACLRYQDQDGLWHQEITDPLSYVETSGSGLILYAVGVGLAKGLLPEAARAKLLLGLQGYLAYIKDGSVFHTCPGCLSPGRGTILDYEARGPVLNDPHAFGPVTLAFGQAFRLGIEEVSENDD